MNYISLGFNCNVALALRNCKLDKETNVFDWLVSHPKDILNILKNNIKDFLKDDINFLLFSLSKQKYLLNKDTKNKIIYDKNTNLIFEHDYDGTFDSIITTKNKYKRRIIRLKNILAGNNKILFIFSGKSNHNDYINNSHSISTLEYETDCKEYYLYLQEISNYLKITYPLLKFHILSFNLYNKFEDFEIENFTHKFLGNFTKRKDMENKIYKFLMNIKKNNFNNLKKFISTS